MKRFCTCTPGSSWRASPKKKPLRPRCRSLPVNAETGNLEIETLDGLLGDRTRLVCFSHCSNIVGRINDAKAITQRVHDAGALVAIDGVAYAPHRSLDVKALDADFYMLSLYKLFGPHVSLLYAKRGHLEKVPGQNHFFLNDRIPLKLNPGGPNHEFTSALAGIADYFEALVAHHLDKPPNPFKARVDDVFALMRRHEVIHGICIAEVVAPADRRGTRAASAQSADPGAERVHDRVRGFTVGPS